MIAKRHSKAGAVFGRSSGEVAGYWCGRILPLCETISALGDYFGNNSYTG